MHRGSKSKNGPSKDPSPIRFLYSDFLPMSASSNNSVVRCFELLIFWRLETFPSGGQLEENRDLRSFQEQPTTCIYLFAKGKYYTVFYQPPVLIYKAPGKLHLAILHQIARVHVSCCSVAIQVRLFISLFYSFLFVVVVVVPYFAWLRNSKY